MARLSATARNTVISQIYRHCRFWLDRFAVECEPLVSSLFTHTCQKLIAKYDLTAYAVRKEALRRQVNELNEEIVALDRALALRVKNDVVNNTLAQYRAIMPEMCTKPFREFPLTYTTSADMISEFWVAFVAEMRASEFGDTWFDMSMLLTTDVQTLDACSTARELETKRIAMVARIERADDIFRRYTYAVKREVLAGKRERQLTRFVLREVDEHGNTSEADTAAALQDDQQETVSVTDS